MKNEDYSTEIAHGDQRITVTATGFAKGETCAAFTSLRFNGYPEISVIMDPAHMRELAEILTRAADFADPREASAADLGIAA